MNEKHHSSLKQYINDMIALEKDIANAIEIQLEDERVTSQQDLPKILREALHHSEVRSAYLKNISEAEGGSLGAAVKESITAVTGTLAGIYGKMREHPLSRMVRDDIIALDVATTSYGMLYTLALAVGHSECATVAKKGLYACPPLVIALTDLLPRIVAGELADDAPLTNPAAAQIATAEIRDSWKHRPHPAEV